MEQAQARGGVGDRAPHAHDEFTADDLQKFLTSVHSTAPVAGHTHNFYRYPARFSPQFARAAIETFSKPGDTIFDPFTGGGTTAVESLLAGRRFVGCDVNSLARFVAWFSRAWEYLADQIVVDGFVNVFAGWTYNLAVTLRQVQTGRLRQYVMFIVLGAIAVFVVVFLFWSPLATAQH